MLLHDVDAVLLDMDGTLVDSTPVVEHIWTLWARDHGLDVEKVLSVVHGRQGHESMAELLPDRPHEQNLAENEQMLADEVTQVDGVTAIPGSDRFLASLDSVPHALVTSATRELATARMGVAGLPMPAEAVTAEQVAASKPDPEGFLRAAAALGVAPERCVVFEDSLSGVRAGLAAGMRVVGVGADTGRYGAHVVVDDLQGVHAIGERGSFALELPAR